MARTITVQIQGWTPPKRRAGWMVRLGCRIMPAAITDAWYAADCPPRLDASSAGVSMRDRIVWRVSCWLRGCRRKGV